MPTCCAHLAEKRRLPEAAARLYGAAAALRKANGDEPYDQEKAFYQQHQQEARAQLNTESWDRAYAEGLRLSVEQAIEYGLSVCEAKGPGQPVPVKKGAKTLPAGLTRREVEVLCLVADGLSDAEVAEKLFLSPRTINAHLTSIYNKLDVSSRAAATRYVIEQHLCAGD